MRSWRYSVNALPELTFKTHHLDNLWVYVIGYHLSLGGDIFQHLVQSLCLDLLSLEFRIGVVKVEQDCALMQLADEKLWPLTGRGFCTQLLRYCITI